MRRQNPNQTLSIASIWESLQFDFNQVFGLQMDNMTDMRTGLGLFGQYLESLREFLVRVPETPLAEQIRAEIAVAVPEGNLQNVTMQELTTVFRHFYMRFLDWYNMVISTSQTGLEITDGGETLIVVKSNATGGMESTFVTDNSLSGFALRVEQIAEWVALKFGNVIIEGSCNLCS